MENICIIPLRSKSKSLKNKNIKLLNKLPLCIYSIKVAIESKIFKKIFIAIDDVKYEIIISSFIKKLKINKTKVIFFYRSKFSSRDNSKTEIVLNEILRNNSNYTYCYLLQATSPLIQRKDLEKVNKMTKNNYDSLFSSYETKKFLWHYKKNKLKNLNYDFLNRPMRQKQKNCFVENGAIYVFKIKKFLQYKNRLFGKIGTFIMEKKNSLDINDIDDFRKAEKILKEKKL